MGRKIPPRQSAYLFRCMASQSYDLFVLTQQSHIGGDVRHVFSLIFYPKTYG